MRDGPLYYDTFDGGIYITRAIFTLAALTCCAPLATGNLPGYVASEACAGCHREIWATYRRTAMGRSFYRPSPANTVEDFAKNTFHHEASDSYFSMIRRDGKYYQRRYQIDGNGKQVNAVEKRIDFVMGSGNHARTYLHRTERNTLVELPLAWYAEKGGYWGMNPGYDRPNHDGFRRTITYDCMFCHNAYPEIPAAQEKPFAVAVYAGSMPEGIDCQRCHGPGLRHVQLAKTRGAKPAEVRGSIVNPSRLSAQRQVEVCMQCHLESTSAALPNAVQRFERGPFSYRPGEPLGAFKLYFDHAAGTGREEKFELVSAAYRLRRSACFQKSEGKLLCTTCHNPHDAPRGAEAARHYTAVCRQCHTSAFNRLVTAGKHPDSKDCASCHMPKRRTADVVHAAVTDHYIQRRNPAVDLLAERKEIEEAPYRGNVALYYPEKLPGTPENELYLAIAQVRDQSNLKEGIARLGAAIARYTPARADFYLELAEAWRNSGDLPKALPFYEEAVRRDAGSWWARQKLGSALRSSGRTAEAAEALGKAVSLAPDSASSWHELGLAYRALGRRDDAVRALENAIHSDPDMFEAYNNLGVIQAAAGERTRAATAFREAIRIQPSYADAHGNLANLLAAAGDFVQALHEFEVALRLRPEDAATRYNYAVALGQVRHFDEAQRELEASLRTDATLVDAHELLGDLLMAKGQARAALPHYEEAIRLRPEAGRAQLSLGLALASLADWAGAVPHLQKAATDLDPAVREDAVQALRQIGKGK